MPAPGTEPHRKLDPRRQGGEIDGVQKSSKAIRNGVLAVLGLIVCIWLARHIYPVLERRHLKHLVDSIEPWTGTTTYSEGGINRLVSVAKSFQGAEPAMVQRVLESALADASGASETLAVEQGREYLLLRVMFDLPENALAGTRLPAQDYSVTPPPENPDNSVNLAWPLTVAQGKVRLSGNRQQGPGSSYSGREDYDYLRYKFRSRNLAGLSGG
jgi:hypothetical protein